MTTHLAPARQEVKPTLFEDDCVLIIFGFGFGTATVESAARNARPGGEPFDRDFINKPFAGFILSLCEIFMV